MRKIAKKVASGEDGEYIITSKNVRDFLGARKLTLELANRKAEIGVATGLAWTQYGGEILFCESIRMPGKGNILMTGLLGEVMKESARIAMSYLKSNSLKYKINPKDFEKFDVHIHFPAGAVPKDGPSAGVTLTTSLASLFIQRKVRHDIAMTGEITLLGKVLPIGGLKEKLLAAKRAGIKQVIVPADNKDSISEIDADIIEEMKIIYVSDVSEILKMVLLAK
jgi:ATP-dependent Lon protease